MRFFRARTISAGFLALSASLSFLGVWLIAVQPARAQFPIRQVPRTPTSPAGPSAPLPGNTLPGNPLPGQPPYGGAALPGQPHGASLQPATTTPPHPAVARITVPEKDGISYGSGTLVDARGQFGLVVSNWHVVRDAAGPITVEFPDGFKSAAQVVKTDKDWDLAALSIYRPPANPVPVSSIAPQPGQWLTIAGYGSGQWRTAGGPCTQYLAPGVEFPHEMVELAAEARQGDSGGPILNERGELAGVLFGSGPGYTSGSYGGRVLKFLTTVVPGGVPGNDSAAANLNALAVNTPPQPAAPQATALHEPKPLAQTPLASAPPVGEPGWTASSSASDRPAPIDSAALTPVQRPDANALLTPPPKREADDRFGASSLVTAAEVPDERVAVAPNRLASATPPLPAAALPELPPLGVHTSLAPRVPGSPAVDVHRASTQQLLAAMWHQFGGTTVYDQTRSVLAIVGIFSLVVFFWRMGGEKEPPHEE
jgi:S1-C subfamily serine protease